MKTRLLSTAVILFAFGSWMVSCKKDADPITPDLVVAVSNEATMDAQQDEIDDMASTQLQTATPAGGRVAAGTADDRVSCARITFDSVAHTLLIDFDHKADGTANPAGCTDGKGNTRKGIINITVNGGPWYKGGSTFIITLNNYSINGVTIQGVRTISNISDNTNNNFLKTQVWTVEAQHQATWADGTHATRNVHKTRTWDVVNETLTVTQTANSDTAADGITRGGNTYSMQITSGLVYSVECITSNKVYIPIRGAKSLLLGSAIKLDFDFGDGTCDRTFTVSYNGHTDTITASN